MGEYFDQRANSNHLSMLEIALKVWIDCAMHLISRLAALTPVAILLLPSAAASSRTRAISAIPQYVLDYGKTVIFALHK